MKRERRGSKKKAVICLLVAGMLKFNKMSQKRRPWEREWIMRRDECGPCHSLVKELQLEDQNSVMNVFEKS